MKNYIILKDNPRTSKTHSRNPNFRIGVKYMSKHYRWFLTSGTSAQMTQGIDNLVLTDAYIYSQKKIFLSG